MTKLETITGIVTKSQNYREKDRLITLFTPTEGLLTGIVKGVGRKKMAATDPGTEVEYVIRRSKTALFTCHTATVKHAFLGTRRSAAHIRTTLALLALLIETQHETTPSHDLYALLTAYLSALSHFDDPAVLLESFTLKLTRLDGHLSSNLTPRENLLVNAKSFTDLKNIT